MENIQKIILKNKNFQNIHVPICTDRKKHIRANFSILLNSVKASEKKLQRKKISYLMLFFFILVFAAS